MSEVKKVKVELVSDKFGAGSIASQGSWYAIDENSGLSISQFVKGNTYDLLVESKGFNKTTGKPNYKIVGLASSAPKAEVSAPKAASNGSNSELTTRLAIYKSVIESAVLPTLITGAPSVDGVVSVVSELAEALIKKAKGE